jgi:methyl-accepting chemotaxis protein
MKWSIGRKFNGSFFLVMFISLGLISYFSITGLLILSNRALETHEIYTMPLLNVQNITAASMNLERAFFNLSFGDVTKKDEYINSYNENFIKFQQGLDKYIKEQAIPTLINTGEMLKSKGAYENQMRDEIQSLKVLTDWRNVLPIEFKKVAEIIKVNKAEAQSYFLNSVQSQTKEVSTALNVLAGLQAEQSKFAVEVSAATTKDVIGEVVLVTILSLILGTIFFYFLSKSIVVPIQKLLLAAKSISETGNLKQVIDSNSKDETGELAQAFKSMTLYLQEMADISAKFAEGDLSQKIIIRSDQDIFGRSFAEMAIYLQEMAGVSGKIAEGDLTQTIKVRSDKDAFGLSLQNMLNGLRKLITQTLSVADSVLVSSQQLSSSALQMSSATQEIAASVQQIVAGTQSQAQQVEETTKAIGQINKNVDQVASGAQASAATSIQATQVAENGNVLMQNTLEKINKIFDTVLNSAKVVQNLGDRSEQIGGIVEVITKIADQTNLLALNAAIEAARAGEAGRGFAVVADEVRKLAEGSAKAAEQIGDLIKGIQKETGDAVISMERGSSEVTEGRQVAEKASKALEEIIQTVKMTATSIQLIANSAQEMVAGTQQVVMSIDEVAASAEQAASGAEQVGASTQEMSASMQQIAASSEDLSEMARTLRETVQMFKVDTSPQINFSAAPPVSTDPHVTHKSTPSKKTHAPTADNRQLVNSIALQKKKPGGLKV